MQRADEFPIIPILAEEVLESEAMGSKRKFWFQKPGGGPSWLFKYPQTNTGQHWAEKIAAEIAKVLEISHARVELALFYDVRGSATESFAVEGRELYHGNQILAGQVEGYDRDKKFKQSRHTLANIYASLDKVFGRPLSATTAKHQIAQYLVFDALIGNTDRHHENWGILLKRMPTGHTGQIAPSFDHASSLGRELRDDGTGKCRSRILKEDRIGQYAENAPGAIYWDENDKRGLSPLELVRRATARYPDLFRPTLNRLDMLKKDELERIAGRVPAGWMTAIARSFTIELTCYNLNQLKQIAT